ncbi:MAG: hypothetical protein OXO52_22025 [Rhodospirillales bacterium]|nr:hypothetical protein [Rhodospirillales bacterium]
MTANREPQVDEGEAETRAGTDAGEEAEAPARAAGEADAAGNGAPEGAPETASGEAADGPQERADDAGGPAGAEAGGRAARGLPPDGDATDEGSGAEAEAKPDDELRRCNRYMEQMLAGMDGLAQELSRTGSKLDSLKLPEAKPADAGNAGPAAEPAPAEDAAPDADGASNADGGTGQMADFYRWIETDRRRWSLAAMAAVAPAALLLGVLVQHQFQPIAPHDPSGGWSGWIWETHGRAIVDCAVDAMRTNGEVDCRLAVRRP